MFRGQQLTFLLLTMLTSATAEKYKNSTLSITIDVYPRTPYISHRGYQLKANTHPIHIPTNELGLHDHQSKCIEKTVLANICPNGFTFFTPPQEKICYIITDNQSFPPSCPYPNFFPYSRIKIYLQNNFYDKILWVHAFRNLSSGFPDFEWVENGTHRTRIAAEDLSNPNDVNKDCLVSKYGVLSRESCFGKYGTLCMYSMDDLRLAYLSHLCDNLEYGQCIFGHYDLSKPLCLCKKLDRSQPPRKQFCSKLAEPTSPFQSELMAKYFDTDSSMCWIALYKEENDTSVRYKWSSTNDDVKYTRWAKPDDCRSTEGAFKFGINPFRGWSLTRDRTLKCAICEFNAPIKETTLQLKYIAHRNEIEVNIYNYMSISAYNGLNLYCFSDSNSDGFKENVSFIIPNMNQIKTVTNVKLATIADQPSHYWCEAFQYFSKTPISSNIIVAFNKPKGYSTEFSLLVNVDTFPGTDPLLNKLYIDVLDRIKIKISPHQNMVLSLRPMRAYFNEPQQLMELLIHLTTVKSQESSTDQHMKIFSALHDISVSYPSIKLVEFLGSEMCMTSFTLTPDNQTLQWPETRIGATAIPANTLCLDKDNGMVPVTRKCEGDFLYGARWADPVGTCHQSTEYSEMTKELFDLVQADTNATNITANLTEITERNSESQPIDVHLMSNVLERLVVQFRNEIDIADFLQIVSNIMGFERRTLEQAQFLLNSTDKILSSLDDLLIGEGEVLIKAHRLIVQITNLESDIYGLALYRTNPKVYSFESYTVSTLFKNTSFDELMKDPDLEAAVLLPIDISADVRRKSPLNTPNKSIIAVFYNDILFNDQNLDFNQHSKTKAISVSIPGFTAPLDSPIKMAFRLPADYGDGKNCSHWKYGLDPNLISIYGSWQINEPSHKGADLVEICEFSHMTHFGLLLHGKPLEEYEKRALQILIIIGSTLSLVGVIPIFFTACLFKSWRCRSGNVILLHFCLAITAQVILTFFLNAVNEDGASCVILGAGLHYVDLSEFCWMFVIALLQYRRFVMVFKLQQEFIVGKCLLFGWALPLFPVMITICISPYNYRINSANYCYVVEDFFIYACLLPITIILLSNAVIFIAIMYSISQQSTAVCSQKNYNYKLEILLALFLFFTLGMTWIFCFISLLGGGLLFTYLFCATSTLRGLVLFLFFILGNKEIRQLWKKRFSYYVSKERQYPRSARCSNAGTLSSDDR